MRIKTRWERCAALALALLFAGAAPMPAVAADSGRATHTLNQGWRFAFGDAHDEKSDAANWQSVTLPHSWNRIGGHAVKAADSDDRKGKGWYRLSFEAPASAGKPRRSWLQFDGASIVADVWLNGIAVGRHAGGVSGFRFDVSEAIRAGENLLVVRTDNTGPETPGSATAETQPMGGDWFMYGGLYRKVSLVTTEPVHIDMADHGGPGAYVRTVSLEPGAASVEVLARIRNAGATAQSARVRVSLLDARGNVLMSKQQPLQLAAAARGETKMVFKVKKPHLWNGVADPYLYTVKVEALVDGRQSDTVAQDFGIRTMRFDADKGFFLNGKPLTLHGVNRHQETGASGWASTDEELRRDYAIIKEIGANTVRLAHYQHSQEEYALADRMGLVVWAELPLVLLTAPHGAAAATPGFIDNAQQQLRELIRQNLNHPSIAVWSIANEPNVSGLWLALKPPTVPLLKQLAALARKEDPSRAAVLASCCGTIPGYMDPATPGAGLDSPPEAVDVFGVNVYFGWYYGSVGDTGAYLDRVHAQYPGKAFSVTEYGAGGALSQHTDNPRGGPVNAFGRPHPEGFQSYIHEETWLQLREKPYLWGTWIWNMFDFGSAMRKEGDLVDTNDKGIVSFDRQVKKDSFYFYKAHWNAEPMLHLAGRRYSQRAAPVVAIKAYSNADKANLFVNGQDRGSAPCTMRICLWPAIGLDQGSNQIEVRASVGGKSLSDRTVWHLADGPRVFRVLAGQLAVTSTTDGLYGSDNFFKGGEGHLLNPRNPFQVAAPKVIANASDQTLYATYRAGRFAYTLPLPNGDYSLTLRFAEPVADQATGKRVFDVAVQGEIVLPGLDIAAVVGNLKALEHTVAVRVTDGKVQLDFAPKVGEAMLSSFSLRPR